MPMPMTKSGKMSANYYMIRTNHPRSQGLSDAHSIFMVTWLLQILTLGGPEGKNIWITVCM